MVPRIRFELPNHHLTHKQFFQLVDPLPVSFHSPRIGILVIIGDPNIFSLVGERQTDSGVNAKQKGASRLQFLTATLYTELARYGPERIQNVGAACPLHIRAESMIVEDR